MVRIFILKLTKKRIDVENEAEEIWKERSNKSNEEYTKLLKKYNLDKIQYEKEQKRLNDDIKKWKFDFEFVKSMLLRDI